MVTVSKLCKKYPINLNQSKYLKTYLTTYVMWNIPTYVWLIPFDIWHFMLQTMVRPKLLGCRWAFVIDLGIVRPKLDRYV